MLLRMGTAVPSLAGVIVVTFLLTRVLPGDPAVYFAGPVASASAIADIRHQLGLDLPLWQQFLRYLGDLAHGDLGVSLGTGQPVLGEIAQRLPASAELTLAGLLVAVVVAVPLGVLAALRQDSWIDHLCRVLTTAGVSLPVFFTGLLAVYVFYYRLGWAPAPLGRLDSFLSPPPAVTGFYLVDSLLAGDAATFLAALRQLVLPALTLAVFALAPLARVTRAGMLSALAPTCWWRRCSPGPASAPTRSTRWSPRTSRRCRASCWPWRSSTSCSTWGSTCSTGWSIRA